MEIKNLCKAYGDLPVLENVSFTAGVGVTALWGPSGVGKTTLLRILLGLEKPDSGERWEWPSVGAPFFRRTAC